MYGFFFAPLRTFLLSRYISLKKKHTTAVLGVLTNIDIWYISFANPTKCRVLFDPPASLLSLSLSDVTSQRETQRPSGSDKGEEHSIAETAVFLWIHQMKYFWGNLSFLVCKIRMACRILCAVQLVHPYLWWVWKRCAQSYYTLLWSILSSKYVIR